MRTVAFAFTLVTVVLMLHPLARGAAHLARALMGSALGRSLRLRVARADPGVSAELARRAELRRMGGLPLTLAIGATLCLAAWSAGMVSTDWISRCDHWTEDLLSPYRTVPLVNAFAGLTNLGRTAALAGIVLVATGLLSRLERPLVLPLWVAFLGSEVSTWLAKYGFDRPRPDIETGISALGPSFPSAHASGSMAVFGFLAYAIARGLGRGKTFEVWYWAVVLVFVVGFSRVFLGVHYLSDVVAGWAVGAFWVLAATALTGGQAAAAVGDPK